MSIGYSGVVIPEHWKRDRQCAEHWTFDLRKR